MGKEQRVGWNGTGGPLTKRTQRNARFTSRPHVTEAQETLPVQSPAMRRTSAGCATRGQRSLILTPKKENLRPWRATSDPLSHHLRPVTGDTLPRYLQKAFVSARLLHRCRCHTAKRRSVYQLAPEGRSTAMPRVNGPRVEFQRPIVSAHKEEVPFPQPGPSSYCGAGAGPC
ncbi:hypothetical protein SKAU_G00270470 [Synaphobranchus kaupii]|uniref:Uncharacterized protein n=1 Tax=Synaphobranchus kaupii TaxID=118154 RepID=A0A9Q1F088_SYNKA|nr:hypothetical protein SKAU_G00270470 [Synaphobranchus kaupii]